MFQQLANVIQTVNNIQTLAAPKFQGKVKMD